MNHGGADYDCAGGSGDGPYFIAPSVVYTVTGTDPYGLDGNGDGAPASERAGAWPGVRPGTPGTHGTDER